MWVKCVAQWHSNNGVGFEQPTLRVFETRCTFCSTITPDLTNDSVKTGDYTIKWVHCFLCNILQAKMSLKCIFKKTTTASTMQQIDDPAMRKRHWNAMMHQTGLAAAKEREKKTAGWVWLLEIQTWIWIHLVSIKECCGLLNYLCKVETRCF